jgi:hypothetical protein
MRLLNGELSFLLSRERIGYTRAIIVPQMQQVPEKPLPDTQSKRLGMNRRNMKLRRETE